MDDSVSTAPIPPVPERRRSSLAASTRPPSVSVTTLKAPFKKSFAISLDMEPWRTLSTTSLAACVSHRG